MPCCEVVSGIFFHSLWFIRKRNEPEESCLLLCNQKKVDEKSKETIMEILEQCETGIFTDANAEVDRTALLKKTTEVLEQIDT